jgi:very-short-patch-repair endonuclease
MTLKHYLQTIDKRFCSGISTEHTFRGDLQTLLESIVPDVLITNEPTRIACGAPDYILTKDQIPLGYIEAKDIGLDLHSKLYKEQFTRYKSSLPNLIITDYLTFELYRDGQFITDIKIGEIKGDEIKAVPNMDKPFAHFIQDFCLFEGHTIGNAKKLAEMMANSARLLANVIENALTSDEENREDSSLKEQMNAFKKILIHDITAKGFADVYAQTIAYGMFAARYHDPSLDTFTRQEAAELIPKSNPFLRRLFGYIAGPDIDDRIKWIVEALANVFRFTDVTEILKDFGKSTQQTDPIIHFYETFLSEYDPKLRKARGVWYTPAPVVNFIVRAVDDILKTEFNLPQGLADSSKTKITMNSETPDKRSKTGYRLVEKEIHKVQILDPATGTGTFLAEIIQHIHTSFSGQQGVWNSYVEKHLLPRLNGFELLMASYAMAHLKLDLLLHKTGYKPAKPQRFKVYLTNSLEEFHPDTGTVFATWLSDEANEANYIKRDCPVMVVLGNPPYSVSSSNQSEWIKDLIKDYKKDLNERNIQPLSDDYIKFIRYGQHFIDKNGYGVLAYISNNSFLDGIIHRQMRKHLLVSFDKIYILDLHGNAKKKETCPDGSPDQNVFDIMQGVSINIFVKTGKKKKNELGKVFHHDLFGKREEKYEFLKKEDFHNIKWKCLDCIIPNYFLVHKNFSNILEYKGFRLNELFFINGAGVQTKRDNLFIDFREEKLITRILKLLNNEMSLNDKNQYNIRNSSSYNLIEKINTTNFKHKCIIKYNYRVFDERYIYYDKNLIGRSFYNIMQHMLYDNLGLIVSKQQSSFYFQHVFITNYLTDHNSISMQTKEASFIFPLYLYPEPEEQLEYHQETTPPFGHPYFDELNTASSGGEFKGKRVPNLNMEMVDKIAEQLGMRFTPEKKSPASVDTDSKCTEHNSSPTAESTSNNSKEKTSPFSEKFSITLEKKSANSTESPASASEKNSPPFTESMSSASEKNSLPFTGSMPSASEENTSPFTGSMTSASEKNSPPLEGWMPQADGVVLTHIHHHPIRQYYPQNLPYNSALKTLAREKRQAGILSEVLFWKQVHKRKFHNIDFDRQRIIGNYIVYFYVKKLGLIIEIDGISHNEKMQYDANRLAYFESVGLKIFRCSDSDIKTRLDSVMKALEEFIINEYGQMNDDKSSSDEFAPIDLLDYIYAVLHSPSYREKYKEFLKIDFPRVPYPKDKNTFWQLAKLGGELRQIHLLESPIVESFITTFPHDGDNIVVKPKFVCPKEEAIGRVYINETQYFGNVPAPVWNFYIGGYQPAQKWLKDRKNRKLDVDEIYHYQKIIAALSETDRLMKEFDKIGVET